MKRSIPIAGPWITQKEIDYVADAVANAWYQDAGIYHVRFENAFAEYVGRKHAIALPTCTSAIHLALLALGVGKGDEVIVPELTWIATAAPITYVGATPVFCDVDKDTWCMDVEALKIAITPRTKAIIPVDLYGGMPDYDEILKIAKKHNIAVIEDAAQAIGSEYKKHKAGSFGTVSCFSFHGSKTMTTGEGGMLVTDMDEVYNRALHYRDHCREGISYRSDAIGYKYKMSSMQAALGLAQLERIDELVEKKLKLAEWYTDRLWKCKKIICWNLEASHTKNSYWMTSIVIDSDEYNNPEIYRNEVMEALKERNIGVRPVFYPLSRLAAYGAYSKGEYVSYRSPNADYIGRRGISLPSALCLTEEDVDYVCKNLLEILDA